MQNYTLFTGWRVLSQTFMSQVKCNVWLAICMHIEHIFHHTYHKYFDIDFRYFFGYSFSETMPTFSSENLWTAFEQNFKKVWEASLLLLTLPSWTGEFQRWQRQQNASVKGNIQNVCLFKTTLNFIFTIFFLPQIQIWQILVI